MDSIDDGQRGSGEKILTTLSRDLAVKGNGGNEGHCVKMIKIGKLAE